MQVSWIFILFLTTLALAVVFATLSFLRTRKTYKDKKPRHRAPRGTALEGSCGRRGLRAHVM